MTDKVSFGTLTLIAGWSADFASEAATQTIFVDTSTRGQSTSRALVKPHARKNGAAHAAASVASGELQIKVLSFFRVARYLATFLCRLLRNFLMQRDVHSGYAQRRSAGIR